MRTNKIEIESGATYGASIIITGLTSVVNAGSTDNEIPTAKSVYNSLLGGSVAGSDKQVQFNSGGTEFGASSSFVYDDSLKSLAIGIGCGATGLGSTASGRNNTASGIYSTASGYKSNAYGIASTASGYVTNATGVGAHAEGSGTVANATGAHAEGNSTTASGTASHSEGNNTIASGKASHTEGSTTTASGDYSHTGGKGIGSYKIIASGNTSFNHSYRENTTPNVSGATGDYSAILGGKNNSATGEGSIAFGYETIAVDDVSVNLGSNIKTQIGFLNFCGETTDGSTWVKTTTGTQDHKIISQDHSYNLEIKVVARDTTGATAYNMTTSHHLIKDVGGTSTLIIESIISPGLINLGDAAITSCEYRVTVTNGEAAIEVKGVAGKTITYSINCKFTEIKN